MSEGSSSVAGGGWTHPPPATNPPPPPQFDHHNHQSQANFVPHPSGLPQQVQMYNPAAAASTSTAPMETPPPSMGSQPQPQQPQPPQQHMAYYQQQQDQQLQQQQLEYPQQHEYQQQPYNNEYYGYQDYYGQQQAIDPGYGNQAQFDQWQGEQQPQEMMMKQEVQHQPEEQQFIQEQQQVQQQAYGGYENPAWADPQMQRPPSEDHQRPPSGAEMREEEETKEKENQLPLQFDQPPPNHGEQASLPPPLPQPQVDEHQAYPLPYAVEDAAASASPPDVASETASRRPPDILPLNDPFIPGDRNLFMQTGELESNPGSSASPAVREPVDGGNDQEQTPGGRRPMLPEDDDVDIPLDRLVLGQSEQLPPPPPPTGPQLNPFQAHQPTQPPPPVQDRVILGQGEVNEVPSATPLKTTPPLTESPIRQVVSGVAANDGASLDPPPPPPIKEERSAAVGSDRRDESVMGPPQTLPPPPPSGNRDVAGADDNDDEDNNDVGGRANNNNNSLRNGPEDDHKSEEKKNEDDHSKQEQLLGESVEEEEEEDRRRRRRRKDSDHEHHHHSNNNHLSSTRRRRRRSRSVGSSDLDGDLGEDPSSSEQDRHRRGGHGGRQRRQDSPSSSSRRTSDREKDRRHRDYYARERDRDRDHHRRDHNRSSRHHTDYYHNESSSRSFRDDRSYYEESFRHHNDTSSRHYHPSDRSYYGRQSSRPGSRSGSVIDGQGGGGRHNYERDRYSRDYNMMQPAGYFHPYQAIPQQYPMVLPDRDTMNTFEKHWRYYMQNPGQYEQLRLSNAAQYNSLNNYYRMCGEYLRLPPIPSAPTSSSVRPTDGQDNRQQRPESRASINLPQSSETPNTESAESRQQQQISALEQSTIYTDPNAEPRYQQTFNENDSPPTVEAEFQDRQARMTPLKFASPHLIGVFGPLGFFTKVDGKSPLDGQTASLGKHSLQGILSHLPDSKELQDFPGPLVPGRTHKGEVIKFCQAKIQACKSNPEIIDKESYTLLWELMILLLRQKNAIDGSDLGELLLKDFKDVQNNIDGGGESSTDLESSSGLQQGNKALLRDATTTECVTTKFRDYLLYGHKKEGLEYAMKNGLWGHALFLASKMDERSYSNVMLRFANGLAANDPLQTLYQLMSGRQPVAVKECIEWGGDWRPHLAMILSNPSGREGLDARSITTLADNLMDKGFLHAAHFCYLMANVDFGSYNNKGCKMVLIGSDRTLPFERFATNEAIQITEVFEYAQKLSNPDYCMMTLQYFKFLYATRLLDYGFSSSALYYCEQIAACLSKKSAGEIVGDRNVDPATFVSQVLEVSERLKYLDPLYTTREGEIFDMPDPEWIQNFRGFASSFLGGNINAEPGDGYSQYPQDNNQYQPQDYGQQIDQQNLQPSYGHEWVEQSGEDGQVNGGGAQYQDQLEQPPQQIHPPVPAASEDPPLEDKHQTPTMFDPGQMMATASNSSAPPPPPSTVSSSVASSAQTTPRREPPAMQDQGNYFANVQRKASIPTPPVVAPPQGQNPAEQNKEDPKTRTKSNESSVKKDQENKPGVFGRLLGRFIKPPNQMHLPDDTQQSIVWDEDKKAWVDKNADPNDVANAAAVAPPSDMELSKTANVATTPAPQIPSTGPPSSSSAMMAPPPPSGGNKFAGGLGKRRGLAGRIDVFKNSQASVPSTSSSSAAMPPSNDNMTMMSGPPNMFVPPPLPDPGDGDAHHGTRVEAQDQQQQPMMFFNPASTAPAPPSTRRNKYT